jgi:hypothetical protein
MIDRVQDRFGRRNRLLGLWAAERMGLSGAAAEAYAREVVDDLPVAAMELGVDKVLADLTAKGQACTASQVQFELDHLAEHAKQQIMQGVMRGYSAEPDCSWM